MNPIRRLTVVVASCFSMAGLASPPAPSFTITPIKPAEYPLSCNGLAKPIVVKAWDMSFNSRVDDAREEFKIAVAADPKCIVARAVLGTLTPGAEGKQMFDDALNETAGLTEVEQLDLQAMQAQRDADPEKAFTLARKMAGLAPNVFVVNLALARSAQELEKWDEAGDAARKATVLMPSSGLGWNLLGYARLEGKKYDEAISAFRKYVELAPGEPNAHDSLADALLANDQLDEANAEYQKAIDNSGGRFFYSWSGIATVRALRGDWEGARVALANAKAAATQPMDKVHTNAMTAWTWAAQGRLGEALKVVDATQKEAAAAKLEGAVLHAQVLRGQLNLAGGKYTDALKAFTAAEKLKVNLLTPGQQKEFRGRVLIGLVEAQARLGKTAEAQKSLTSLHEFFRENVTGPVAADVMAFGHGLVALSKKDSKEAIESLQNCSDHFDSCRLTLAETQEKAGLSGPAAETRAALLKANHRDPQYWFVRAQLEPKQKMPGT